MDKDTRLNEWFVPKFGPTGFRVFVGLLFLPYTGMCISFALIGSLLAPQIAWDRAAAIVVIYALGLGVSAHAADSIGSKKIKPWGSYFRKDQLVLLMSVSLAAAYALGAYYIIFHTPSLLVIAIMEGFFLFAYNFEIFDGLFHNNFWFAFSWGALPLLAGFVIQTNSVALVPVVAAVAAGAVSYAEIKMSRPYKDLKRSGHGGPQVQALEMGLKVTSIGTIVCALALLVFRIAFGWAY